jgi:hypothetical protein
MTPTEIIEALTIHFKDRMDEEIDLIELGSIFLDGHDTVDCLLEDLRYEGI